MIIDYVIYFNKYIFKKNNSLKYTYVIYTVAN